MLTEIKNWACLEKLKNAWFAYFSLHEYSPAAFQKLVLISCSVIKKACVVQYEMLILRSPLR